MQPAFSERRKQEMHHSARPPKKTRRPRGMRVFGAKRRDAPDHMLSIMTWPKPEQDTWVAPSSKRAKS